MVSDEVGRYHCRAEPGPLAALVERGKDLGLAIAVRSGCCVVKKGLSFICGWGGGGVIVQSDRPRPPPSPARADKTTDESPGPAARPARRCTGRLPGFSGCSLLGGSRWESRTVLA